MLRRYLSFAFPVMFSAACGLTYLHFQAAPAAQAEEPAPARSEIRLAQAEVVPADPAKPAAPAKKTNKSKPAKPTNKDEVKTPMLKNLLTQLEQMNEGTDEEKNTIRDIIFSADVELRDSMGENLRAKIQAANKPKRSFEVKTRPSKPLKVRPKVIEGMKPTEKPVEKPVETKPAEVKPAEPKPAVPTPPAEPKKDPFDDLFGDKKKSDNN